MKMSYWKAVILTSLQVYLHLSWVEGFNCFTDCTRENPNCFKDRCLDRCPTGTIDVPLDHGDTENVFVWICADVKCGQWRGDQCLNICPGGYFVTDSHGVTCVPEWVKTRKLIIIGVAMFGIIVGMGVFLSTKKFHRNCFKNPFKTAVNTSRQIEDGERLLNAENEVV